MGKIKHNPNNLLLQCGRNINERAFLMSSNMTGERGKGFLFLFFNKTDSFDNTSPVCFKTCFSA